MQSAFPGLPQILDVAIVLVAVYATLSCVCSWIQERIASALSLRGWGLFRGIAQLTDDALATQIFNHPIVASNSSDPDREVQPDLKGFARFRNVSWSRPPSYLDARNFSSAFWQVLTAAHLPGLPAAAAQTLPAATPTADAAQALAQLVVGAPTAALQHLESAVQTSATLPDALRLQVLSLLSAAGNDYTKLLATTDGWFNAQMDRVSGWYKRQTQWIIVVIALAVVTVSGVDSLDIVRVLSAADPCVVAQYARAAGDLAGNTGAPDAGLAARCKAEATAPFDVTNFAHFAPLQNWQYYDSKTTHWRWPGLLLTLLALTLGGPFWFDALKSLVNVRSDGPRPQRSDQPPQ
jgi:hypothetical protein